MPFPILKEYLNMADYTTSGYNDTQNLADKYKIMMKLNFVVEKLIKNITQK